MSYKYDAIVLPNTSEDSIPELETRIQKFFAEDTQISITKTKPEHEENNEIFTVLVYKDTTVIRSGYPMPNFLNHLSQLEGKLPNGKTYRIPGKAFAFSSNESVGYQLFLESTNGAITSAFEIKDLPDIYGLDISELLEEYLKMIERGEARNYELSKPGGLEAYRADPISHAHEFAYAMILRQKLGFPEHHLIEILEGEVYNDKGEPSPVETYYFCIRTSEIMYKAEPFFKYSETMFEKIGLPFSTITNERPLSNDSATTSNETSVVDKSNNPPLKPDERPVPQSLALTVGLLGFALIGVFIYVTSNAVIKLVVSPASVNFGDWALIVIAIVLIARKITIRKTA